MPLEHPTPASSKKLVEHRTSQEVRRVPDNGCRRGLAWRSCCGTTPDMSYDDIAETLGVRRTFVGVVLLRARHQLREILEGQGGAILAAGGAA